MSFLCIPGACRQGITVEENWTKKPPSEPGCGRRKGRGNNNNNNNKRRLGQQKSANSARSRPPPSCPPSLVHAISQDPTYNNNEEHSFQTIAGRSASESSESSESNATTAARAQNGENPSFVTSSPYRSSRINPSAESERESDGIGGLTNRIPVRNTAGGGKGRGGRAGMRPANLSLPVIQGLAMLPLDSIEESPRVEPEQIIKFAVGSEAHRVDCDGAGSGIDPCLRRHHDDGNLVASSEGGEYQERDDCGNDEREEKGNKHFSPILLELFTAQGCGSFPRADRILSRLALLPSSPTSKPDDIAVIALAFHVDYWDYLGLSDPYANRKWTTRQRKYVQKLSQQQGVYTPQLVVQGQAHCVGSKPDLVRDIIRSAPRFTAPDIKIESVRLTAIAVSVSLTAALVSALEGVRIVRVKVALVENALSGVIKDQRQDGASRNDRIVRRLGRAFSIAGNTSGLSGKGSVRFSTWSGFQKDRCSLVVFLQDPVSMMIYGCRQFSLEGH